MAKKNYYAVKCGRKTGIFTTWDECKKNVFGFPGAVYKGFETKEEANEYMGLKIGTLGSSLKKAGVNCTGAGKPGTSDKENEIYLPKVYAFVDGSFNVKTKVYGYGGFLVNGNDRYEFFGSGNDPDMASMRNVAGEILGSMEAIKKAIELGLSEITVFYDYMGIQCWADGEWKTNKNGTKNYKEFIGRARDNIVIKFIKVKGHSGIPGNEEADRLAKKAAGID